MKQQRIVLLGVLVLVAGILVWQGIVMAPEIDLGVSEVATSTVLEAGENENLPPVIGADVIPSPNEVPDGGTTMCTMDAKLCLDGSYVGRVAPSCAFAACPAESSDTDTKAVLCSPDMADTDVCPAIYAPVCGLVAIQCITTPCNPIPETFGNACSACARGNVMSYTPGACSGE